MLWGFFIFKAKGITMENDTTMQPVVDPTAVPAEEETAHEEATPAMEQPEPTEEAAA